MTAASAPGRGPAPPATVRDFLGARRPRVIAHRGCSGAAPENTLAAFRRAIAAGADMLELDVLPSRDGELVVIHDDTLERTTNGSGRVQDYDLARLRQLDAGAWFGAGFAGERIPTLAEVLELARGRTLLNIEIKAEAVTDQRQGGAVDRVARLVRAQRMQDAVLLSSFAPRAMADARALAPEIARAALFDAAVHRGQDALEILAPAACAALHLAVGEVTAATVELCHAHGKAVSVYTVNDEAELHRLLALGVDAVFTDWPERMLAELGRPSR